MLRLFQSAFRPLRHRLRLTDTLDRTILDLALSECPLVAFKKPERQHDVRIHLS